MNNRGAFYEVAELLENPLSTPTKTAIAIGGGVVMFGIGAYFFSKAVWAKDPPLRTVQNVQPFVADAPYATYNLDKTQIGSGNVDIALNIHVGDTLTITMPFNGYYQNFMNDLLTGHDVMQSAVYPFGAINPGLASQALGLAASDTKTFGYVAIRAGSTNIMLLPSDPTTGETIPSQASTLLVSVS